MHFALSGEQVELRNSLRKFFADKAPVSAARKQMTTPDEFDQIVWKTMATQLGLVGLCLPNEFGGSEFSMVELGVALHEMGRNLYSGPFFSTVVLAANALLFSGDNAMNHEYLPKIAAGELLGTLAITEGDTWDFSAIETTALSVNNEWFIDGAKQNVLDGAIAEFFVVSAVANGQLSLFLADRLSSNIDVRTCKTLDETRNMATVKFRNTPVRLLGKLGDAQTILSKTLQIANIAIACESVGSAEKCLEMSVDYAKQRQQFGRSIGSFQAVKHKCAEVLLEVESAKSAALYACWSASENNDDLETVALLAKAFCTDAFFRAASENIQIHGGIGFTWEHDAHLFFKRAKTSQQLFGDPSSLRLKLADKIGI